MQPALNLNSTFDHILAAVARRKAARRRVVAQTLPRWRQLVLRLYVRPVVRVCGKICWTRPDGKQVVVKTVRALVTRVMDYDGKMLAGVLLANDRTKAKKRSRSKR